MIRPPTSSRKLFLGFAALLAASLASRWSLTRDRTARCAFDGRRLESASEVALVRGESVVARFCGVACARAWPDVDAGSHWRVRDEISGESLDAEIACFVASGAPGSPVHAFARWSDAMEHAAAYGGERIENPLPCGGRVRVRETQEPHVEDP